MGILCPVILPATCVVPPRNTKFAQRRAVGSELVGHDGGWSDALLLQEFSHQLERRLAVSPWLNEDVQDLAFAVHGTPDVQLSAVDGDEHFVEMPPPVRPRPSSSQLARNDRAELQCPAADRLVGLVLSFFACERSVLISSGLGDRLSWSQWPCNDSIAHS